jgi:integrase
VPRRHNKIPIAPGIYRDGDRLIAEVRIGSSRAGDQQRTRKIFPLGTAPATMIAWQHGAKRDLLETGPARAAAGSLASDIPVYLETLPEGRYKTDSAWLLAHWSASPLGPMARQQIERLDIVAQIARWTEAGIAASSVNKRLSRLRKLYAGLDGPDVPAPTDKITFLPAPEPEPRDISTRIVSLILDSIVDHGRPEKGQTPPPFSITKIRLRVMAWTGIPPATLHRVRPRDLDLKGGQIYLRPRRKGKGAAGVWIGLLPQGIDALRDFAAAKLFGRSYSNSSAGKTWRVGIRRATLKASAHAKATGDRSWLEELEQLPARCRPYDLRHSFGSEMYRRTGDLGAVSELMQHATLQQTSRYTLGAVSARVAAAIAKAAPVYAKVESLPVPSPLRLVKTKDALLR